MNSLIAIAAAIAYTDLGASVVDDDDMEEETLGESEEPEAEAKPPKKKVKKGGKKVAKKEVKKTSKSDGGAKSDKNVVRLKDLAKQAKLTEAVARKKLRDADVPRGEGRWSWELGSKALKTARKALGLSVG